MRKSITSSYKVYPSIYRYFVITQTHTHTRTQSLGKIIVTCYFAVVNNNYQFWTEINVTSFFFLCILDPIFPSTLTNGASVIILVQFFNLSKHRYGFTQYVSFGSKLNSNWILSQMNPFIWLFYFTMTPTQTTSHYVPTILNFLLLARRQSVWKQ